MAKNTNNRVPVKWIRDKAKAAYTKQTFCYVCNKFEDLELHHLHSITILLNRWATIKGYNIASDDGILAVRDEFIAEHRTELYDLVYTLCNTHHVALHSVYGKAPDLNSAGRQKNWVELQKTKFENGGEAVKPHPSISPFGSFY